MNASKRKSKPRAQAKPRAKAKPSVEDKVLIEQALQSMEGKLKGEEIRGTIGDMLRLLEYRKQLVDAQPKDVRVQWVDDASAD